MGLGFRPSTTEESRNYAFGTKNETVKFKREKTRNDLNLKFKMKEKRQIYFQNFEKTDQTYCFPLLAPRETERELSVRGSLINFLFS